MEEHKSPLEIAVDALIQITARAESLRESADDPGDLPRIGAGAGPNSPPDTHPW